MTYTAEGISNEVANELLPNVLITSDRRIHIYNPSNYTWESATNRKLEQKVVEASTDKINKMILDNPSDKIVLETLLKSVNSVYYVGTIISKLQKLNDDTAKNLIR